jgi:DNA-directed RNA polymerase specialized sigma24 family protein
MPRKRPPEPNALDALLCEADKLYQQHKKLIYDQIHKYEKDGIVSFCDLESVSNEVFARCVERWKPERGKFGTLLYIALGNAFTDELRKRERKLKVQEQAAALAPTDTKPFHSHAWLHDFMHALDADARRVVAALLKDETVPTTERLGLPKAKHRMREALPFSRARINHAFDAIQQALRTG